MLDYWVFWLLRLRRLLKRQASKQPNIEHFCHIMAFFPVFRRFYANIAVLSCCELILMAVATPRSI